MSTSSQIRKRAKRDAAVQEKNIEKQERKEHRRSSGARALLWLVPIVLLPLFWVFSDDAPALIYPLLAYEAFLIVLLILRLAGKAESWEPFFGVFQYILPAGAGICAMLRYSYYTGHGMPGVASQNLYMWIAAIVVGVLAAFYELRRRAYRVADGNEDKHAFLILLVVATIFVSSYGQALMLNDALPGGEERDVKYTVTEKSSWLGQFVFRKKLVTFEDADGNRLQADVTADDYDKIKMGSTMTFTVKEGALGTEFVKDPDGQTAAQIDR